MLRSIFNLRSLHVRLIGFHVVLLGIMTAVFGVYLYIGLHHYLVSSLESMLERRAADIEADAEEKLAKGNEKALVDDIITLYAPEESSRFIRITRSDKGIIYVSGIPKDLSFDPGEVMPMSMVSGLHKTDGTNNNVLYIAMAITPQLSQGYRYSVEVGSSDLQIKDALHGLMAILVIGFPAFLLMGAIGAYVLIQRALTPVTEVMNAAEEISIFNLESRLPVAPTGDKLEHLSRALNRMIDRLDTAFQQISRFTADAAHELRTPLTIIKGGLESILKSEQSLSPILRDQLVSILEETERLITMVSKLLIIARLEAGEASLEKRVIDLGRLVEDTAEQMQLLAKERQIRLNVDAEQGIMVDVDLVRIREVIVNLLDNAFRYTPGDGAIFLTVYVDKSKSKAVLCVADTGIGISIDDLPYVFDRFYRSHKLHSRGSGAGLGLSIARSICVAHGGTISVESEEGKGSRFIMTLDIAK